MILFKKTEKTIANGNKSCLFYAFIIPLAIAFFPITLLWIIWKKSSLSLKGKNIGSGIVVAFTILIFVVGETTGANNKTESTIVTETTTRAKITIAAITQTTTKVTTTTKKTETTIATSTTIPTTTTVTTTTTITTVPTTTTTTTTPAPTAPPQTNPPVTQSDFVHFIVNNESRCLHLSADCQAAKKISPENYGEIYIYKEDMPQYSSEGYWACGKCAEIYRKELPKP